MLEAPEYVIKVRGPGNPATDSPLPTLSAGPSLGDWADCGLPRVVWEGQLTHCTSLRGNTS